MEAATIPLAQARPVWGRLVGGLPTLFLLFDAVLHLVKPAAVTEAFVRLGYADSLARPLGLVELICLALYVWPRSAVLGAILLTGYLGGATATQVRLGDPWFVFPIVLGVLLWGGLHLRDARLRALIPYRD